MLLRALAGALALIGLALQSQAAPVSYYHSVLPIFKRSCMGCHNPAKLKGELDLTTVAGLLKGGKHGPAATPGNPAKSLIIDQISGDPPEMPKKGDPLTKAEVELIRGWIASGAGDDTPADQRNPYHLSAPPVYHQPPVISALVFSPDGRILAVSGYHEILLHRADGTGLLGRLVGDSPRIESLAFSPNGKFLAAAGGAPAVFGEVQIWDPSSKRLVKAMRVSTDCAFGVSFSPQSDKLAFGCADKIVRVISVPAGAELLRFDNHSDWVFGTTFTQDGARLLTGSRDRAMKLINVANGQFIDDINKLLEGVLCLARRPGRDEAAYGGDLGVARLYRISDNQGRTAANNDVNLLREFERLPGPIHAVAFSPDGKLLALGSSSEEVPIYNVDTGARAATLRGQSGATFALAFSPDGKQVACAGYDGKVRLFDPAQGKLLKEFTPVPIAAAPTLAAH